jgi:hypothetical protein
MLSGLILRLPGSLSFPGLSVWPVYFFLCVDGSHFFRACVGMENIQR